MSTKLEQRQALIKEAGQAISAGGKSAAEALALAKRLRGVDEFGFARRLLTAVRSSTEVRGDADLDLEFRQQIALCTYKDTHLNEEHRLQEAIRVLDEGGHLERSNDPETLGLAGAVYKRLWQVRHDKGELELALTYYRRGHEADRAEGFRKHRGYPGINAAFVLDVLARSELDTDSESDANRALVAERRRQAAVIREEIVAGLAPQADADPGFWALATLAEACYGLRRFDEARRWLLAARALEGVPDWAFESTARQLAELARLLEFDGAGDTAGFAESEAGKVLLAFLGDAYAGLETAWVGKVGLALSGGGFRASLYHIGVLARLAELDLLRHVEVLSCVSGGSIIGAHYYLELRKLLQEKPDAELTPGDYVELVERVEAGFLKGVQSNLRIRIAAEWLTNLRMIFAPGYSRTRRLGELYESRIYAEIDDGEQDGPRYISDLYVVPKDNEAEGRFNPRRQNWTRAHKVPILVLNATTLNTGHNWQFTASWMGEPPTTVNPEIDSNYRLRRMYYEEAPPAHRKVRLGTAVGASSCVPGLFSPVVLEGLYEHDERDGDAEDITVRLVDGGVHDNQGVVGLVEQDCDVMLVSDASGQIDAQDNPSGGLLAVPLRANSILQARVRDAEFADLKARERSGELREMMFVHLTMGLQAEPVDWIGCEDPLEAAATADADEAEGPLTDYGMNRRVQRLLAGNRTDLDAWCDAEAWALMLSGYRMTRHALADTNDALPLPREALPDNDWRFLAVDALQQSADPESRFMQVLKLGSSRAFKAWRLFTPLKVAGASLLAAAVVVLGWLAWTHWDTRLVAVRDIGIILLSLLVAFLFGKLVMQIVWFRETLMKFALGFAMAIVGFLVARLHLHVINPLYLRLGRVRR